MEERRLLLAVALSLVVLTVFSRYFAPTPPEPGAAPSPAPAAASTPSPAAPAPASVTPGAGPAEAPPAAAVPAAAVADERERRVEVETAESTVAFTNRARASCRGRFTSSATRAVGPRRWCPPRPAACARSTC
ncbi:MAG: hypothetical protein U0599_22405 [Vicinamibacteria bacterium]